MYPPRHFQEHRSDVLQAFIAAHPLGVLIVQNEQGAQAYHLPFFIDDAGTLHAHVARSNPVWHESPEHENVLVIFQGGDGYVSPNWYPSKQEHHKQVPTWNYQAVHARGRLTVRDDEVYIRKLLARLTHKHESAQEKPWKMTDAPQEYIDSMVKAVVGIEIEIPRLCGILKLGQNKSLPDMTSAAENMIKQGDAQTGLAMRKKAADRLVDKS